MLISIITPCLNRAEFVAEAVESVLNQDYPNIEHIIMDGGSTDGTLEVLRRYPHLKVVSQPDRGLYDAINKGISIAKGEIFGFLNTDDLYEPNIFQSVINQFQKQQEAEAVVGGASVLIYNPIKGWCTHTTDPAIRPRELLSRAIRGAPIFNAWFFRRSAFDKLGVFDIQYRYVADRDFLIRLALMNLHFIDVDKTVYHYRSHPDSLTYRFIDTSETDLMVETRDLVENYLNVHDLSKSAYRLFVNWHSQITGEQAITALKKGALDRVLAYARKGIVYNPIWPVIFVERMWLRGIGSIRRRIKPEYTSK